MIENACKTPYDKIDDPIDDPKYFYKMYLFINIFPANGPILEPLKTPENQRFSGVFRGYKMGILARNGLMQLRYWEQKNLDIGVHLSVEIEIGKHHKS